MCIRKLIIMLFLAFNSVAHLSAISQNGTLDEAADLFDQGEYSKSISLYNEIIKAAPNDPIPYLLLGQAYDKNFQYEEAKASFQKVLALPSKSEVKDLARQMLSYLPSTDCKDCPLMVNIPEARNINLRIYDEYGRNYLQSSTISPFSISQTLITQRQWKAVMGDNPSNYKSCGETCPVESVGYEKIQLFLAKLSQKTGRKYRLPTIVEWRYACFGDRDTDFCGSNKLDSVAWYRENSPDAHPRPVATKLPNLFGLYDMNGNVWEFIDGMTWKREVAKNKFIVDGEIIGGSTINSKDSIDDAFHRPHRVATSFGGPNIGFRVVADHK